MRVAKQYPMPKVETVFTFRTPGMQHLYDNVVKNQLTQGQYKTGWWGSHQNDSKFFTDATEVQGTATSLVNLPTTSIKLTGFTRLIPFIGPEMAAKLKEVEPNADIETVRKYLQEISKAIREATPPVAPVAAVDPVAEVPPEVVDPVATEQVTFVDPGVAPVEAAQ